MMILPIYFTLAAFMHSAVTGHFPFLAAFDPNSNVTHRFPLTKNSSSLNHPKSGLISDFIVRDSLMDSENEIRVHFRGITAKEISVKSDLDPDTGKRQELKLRQLTDGKNFIQMIYDEEGTLKDCEFLKHDKTVETFLQGFRKDIERAKNLFAGEDADSDEEFYEDEGELETYVGGRNEEDDMLRNVTFQIINDRLPAELADWMNFKKLRTDCQINHNLIKSYVHDLQNGSKEQRKKATEHLERMKRALTVITPGTKWCGSGTIAERSNDFGVFTKTDRCCRIHDRCRVHIPAFFQKYEYYNYRPFTLSHCRCDQRRKRDVLDILRVPGTQWCGKGGRAPRYTSVGGFSRTDKCCRAHDTTCPFWIGAFQEKYGLFNWRINTIMHCRCDKRFRACLKMAKTGAANFVGKIFFNVVQTQCFVLKPKKVCKKSSWWGKCEKWIYKKQAHLRSNLSY